VQLSNMGDGMGDTKTL